MKPKRAYLPYRGTRCLNCKTPLDVSDRYCSYCGQINSTKKLSLGDFFNEFFAGLFAYDSRLHRTLRSLLFRPGKISKDYIEGKRQQYANPYRFYLSASIIFFILWSISNSFGVETNETLPPDITVAENSVVAKDSVATKKETGTSESFFSLYDQDLEFEEIYLKEQEIKKMGVLDAAEKKLEIFSAYYNTDKNKNAVEALKELKYNNSLYNRWLYKKVVDIDFFHSNPELFLSYFIGKLPFIIFFCLPLFAVFIWLLYLRRSFTYMEHLIFTFHNQTVLFLLLIIMVLLQSIFDTSWIPTTLIFLFLIYLYKSMRRFYGQGRIKTLLKFLILNGIFVILALFISTFAILASFAVY